MVCKHAFVAAYRIYAQRGEESAKRGGWRPCILTGHFQSFFIYFFRPLTLNLKKNPVNQLIKKFWPNLLIIFYQLMKIEAPIAIIIFEISWITSFQWPNLQRAITKKKKYILISKLHSDPLKGA